MKEHVFNQKCSAKQTERKKETKVPGVIDILERYGYRSFHIDDCCYRCGNRIFHGKHLSSAQSDGGIRNEIQRIIEILEKNNYYIKCFDCYICTDFRQFGWLFDEYAHRKRGVTQHTQKA